MKAPDILEIHRCGRQKDPSYWRVYRVVPIGRIETVEKFDDQWFEYSKDAYAAVRDAFPEAFIVVIG